MSEPPLLSVRDLDVRFGPARAVTGVSFDLEVGEALAIVGESGSGKSVTALSLARLVEEPPGRTGRGSSVRYRGEELVGCPPARLREIRGAEIGFVFQEPMTSLNPVQRVGSQVVEAIRAHERCPREEARRRTLSLFERVELPDPGQVFQAYPHELSGGMRQRALIAMAIAAGPAILVADEPTTALDVTVQAQILALIRALRRDTGMALLLISHDLAVVADVVDRVAVMYAGQIVEEGPVRDVFAAPRHPYTEGLLRAVPSIEHPHRGLAVIPGDVPSPDAWPDGCRFHPRCPYMWDRCSSETPPPGPSRCWLVEEPARREGRGYEVVAP